MRASLVSWALFAAFCFLAACAQEFTYTPPTTAEGRSCVAQCQATQSACRDGAVTTQDQCEADSAEKRNQCEVAATEELNTCQRESKTDYYACLKYSSNRATCYERPCFKEACFQQGCSNSADLNLCDGDFRICYQNCGGTVGILK